MTPDLTLYDSAQALESATPTALFDACLARTRRFFHGRLEILFARAHDRLFAEARNAGSDREQREYFDAMQELHGIKAAVQAGFVGDIVAALERLWSAEVEAAAAEAADLDADDMALVDTQSLEDHIAVTKIATRARDALRTGEHRLAARLGRLLPAPLHVDSNPLGVLQVCAAFHKAVQNLGVERPTRRALFEGLETTVLRDLGLLHRELDELLEEARVEQAPARPIAAPPAATPAPAQDVAPGAVLGSAADAVAVSSPWRASHDGGPHIALAAAHETARRLIALARGVPAPAAQAPALGLDAALARIQARAMAEEWGEKGPYALAARVRAALAQEGVALDDLAVSDTLDVVSTLFEHILADPLVQHTARPFLRRAGLPVLRAALADGAFFASDSHPARRLLDRLGRLVLPDPTATVPLPSPAEVVDRALAVLLAAPFPDRQAFARAADALESLLEGQRQAFNRGVVALVARCDAQRGLLKPAGDPRPLGSASLSAEEAAHADWVRALETVAGLEPGAVVVDGPAAGAGGAPITGLAMLAWRSPDGGVLVFADALGRHAGSLAARELAMALHRGALRLDEAAGMSIVDRAMCNVLQHLHGRLEDKAHRDEVTGLANRKRLEAELARALRNPVAEPRRHHLCVLGLSCFEEVAARFGTRIAERLVRRYAQVLERQVGASRITAYLGRGRFAVLLANAARSDALRLVERHRRSIELSKCELRGETIPLAVSIGVVAVPPGASDATAVLAAAEGAQQTAAASSPGGLQIQDVPAVTPPAGLDIGDLIGGHRLTLRCQRVQPLAPTPERLPYYEVLLGVRHGDGRVGPPGEVIAAVERAGRSAEIDRWVIARTLRWFAANAPALEGLAGLAINLSGGTLNDPGLARFVKSEIEAAGIPGARIMFEITESTAIEQLSVAHEVIEKLRALGCRFALDDFGAGHATFSYLKLLPVDTVKIDGLFVRNIVNDASDEAVVRSIHDIATLLGKRTVAEFAQDEATVERLRSIGIDYAQGYAVERPRLLADLAGGAARD